jgi:hydroxypyruvate isomerase
VSSPADYPTERSNWWDRLDLVVNVSTVVGDLPFEARPAAVAQHGFGRIESWWPFASGTMIDDERERFIGTIHGAELELLALNAYAGDAAAGEFGFAGVPGEQRRFLRAVEAAFAIGTDVNCHRFNILVGNRSDRSPEEVEEQAVESLSLAAELAAEVGHVVLLEVLNSVDRPDYALTDLTTALRWIDRVRERSRTEAIALLFDAYHLAMQGEDLDAAARRSAGVIGHVQLADSPGRAEPGTGTINFPAVLTSLESAGYDGPIALEYFPTNPARPFGWMATSERTPGSVR